MLRRKLNLNILSNPHNEGFFLTENDEPSQLPQSFSISLLVLGEVEDEVMMLLRILQ